MTTTQNFQPKRRACSILISFSGMDGSGKSTQIEQLCADLSAAGLHVERREFWNNVVAFPTLRAGFSKRVLQSDGTIGSPEKPANRNDKNARKWYLIAGRHFLYLLDAFKLRRAVARTRRSNADVIVFDRYIYDQLATLPLHHFFTAFYARFILSFVPKPQLPYVLDAVPEVARARKPEYPLDFMHRYRNAYHQLARMAGLCIIPPLDMDQTHSAIVRELEPLIQRPVAELSSLSKSSSSAPTQLSV